MIEFNFFKKIRSKGEDVSKNSSANVKGFSEHEKIDEEKTGDTKIQDHSVLAEYHETLRSSDASSLTRKEEVVWRDVTSIEKKVDNLHRLRAEKPKTQIDKNVDKILSRRKKRKRQNVVYVVNDPQPGEVRGDWGVRYNKKILSHHKTKENAIKMAKKIAREKNGATVMIQRTDGTFSRGIKIK